MSRKREGEKDRIDTTEGEAGDIDRVIDVSFYRYASQDSCNWTVLASVRGFGLELILKS